MAVKTLGLGASVSSVHPRSAGQRTTRFVPEKRLTSRSREERTTPRKHHFLRYKVSGKKHSTSLTTNLSYLKMELEDFDGLCNSLL